MVVIYATSFNLHYFIRKFNFDGINLKVFTSKHVFCGIFSIEFFSMSELLPAAYGKDIYYYSTLQLAHVMLNDFHIHGMSGSLTESVGKEFP